MGAFYCKNHELTGAIYACEHISDSVSGKNSQQSTQINEITLTRLIFTKRLLIPGIYAYCDKCSEEFRLHRKRFSSLSILTIHLRKFMRFNTTTRFTCVECIYENFFQVKLGNNPLPYLDTTKKILISQVSKTDALTRL